MERVIEISKTRSPHFARGVICTLLGAGLWGFSGACAQLLLHKYGMAATTITCIRMVGAGLVFLIVILVRERSSLFALLREWKSLLQVAIFGICGLFLCQFTYLLTIGHTNAGTATILQSLGILFVMVFTCVTVRRWPRVTEAVGILLAIGATVVIATHGNLNALVLPLAGLLWGIAAGLSSAFYMVFPKNLLKRWGSLLVTGIGMLIGGIASSVFIHPWTSPISLSLGSIVALAAIILIGTFLAFFLFMQGVADIGPVRTSMLGAMEPVSATLFSWLWLGTQFAMIDIIGFAMMIAMVLLITGEKAGKRRNIR